MTALQLEGDSEAVALELQRIDVWKPDAQIVIHGPGGGKHVQVWGQGCKQRMAGFGRSKRGGRASTQAACSLLAARGEAQPVACLPPAAPQRWKHAGALRLALCRCRPLPQLPTSAEKWPESPSRKCCWQCRRMGVFAACRYGGAGPMGWAGGAAAAACNRTRLPKQRQLLQLQGLLATLTPAATQPACGRLQRRRQVCGARWRALVIAKQQQPTPPSQGVGCSRWAGGQWGLTPAVPSWARCLCHICFDPKCLACIPLSQHCLRLPRGEISLAHSMCKAAACDRLAPSSLLHAPQTHHPLALPCVVQLRTRCVEPHLAGFYVAACMTQCTRRPHPACLPAAVCG